MNCPHCGAEHAEEKGRFCEACGMSVISYAKRTDEEQGQRETDPETWPRCRACGTKSANPICPGCGGKMPEPE